jgi:hypothetical protein
VPSHSLPILFAVGIVGAAPFLLVQVVLNANVTGHPFRHPVHRIRRPGLPADVVRVHRFDPTARPVSSLKVKQDAYDDWVVPFVKGLQPDTAVHTWLRERVPVTVECAFPHAFLLVLVPVGLLALGDRRWVVAGVMPLFLVGYGVYAFFLQPYTVITAPRRRGDGAGGAAGGGGDVAG